MRFLTKMLAFMGFIAATPQPIKATPVTPPPTHVETVVNGTSMYNKTKLPVKEWQKRKKARAQQELSRRINRK